MFKNYSTVIQILIAQFAANTSTKTIDGNIQLVIIFVAIDFFRDLSGLRDQHKPNYKYNLSHRFHDWH